MQQKQGRLQYNTTSVLKSIFLAVPQVLLPCIIILILYVALPISNEYRWIILLCGSLFIVFWTIFATCYSILKEWCYLDQLNFNIPLVFTLIFLFWGDYVKLREWYFYILSIIVIICVGFLIARILIHYLTIKAKLSIFEKKHDYNDLAEIHEKEKEYLRDFLDLAVDEQPPTSKSKKIRKKKKSSDSNDKKIYFEDEITKK